MGNASCPRIRTYSHACGAGGQKHLCTHITYTHSHTLISIVELRYLRMELWIFIQGVKYIIWFLQIQNCVLLAFAILIAAKMLCKRVMGMFIGVGGRAPLETYAL